MQTTIRAGKSTYVPLGLICMGLIVMWSAIWIFRGPQTGAWQPILLILVLYCLWVFAVRRRTVIVSDDDITCTYVTRKPRRAAWSEVRRSEVNFWMQRIPFQIVVYGEAGDAPLLDIPIGIYDREDVDFLLGLDRLRIARSSQ